MASRFDILLRTLGACAFGFVSAAVVSAGLHYALRPAMFRGDVFYLAQFGAFIGMILLAVPCLIVLIAVFLQRREASVLFVYVVAIWWLSFLFLSQASKPWRVYGDFPWWLIQGWLPHLPILLVFALIFGVAQRSLSRGPESGTLIRAAI